MRMHVLAGGRLKMRRSIYYPGSPREETVELPVSCVLLRHPQGNVLFDTGCNPLVASEPEARWGGLARVMTPIFAAEDTVVHQLALTNLRPDDIDLVICSHLHPDHCGCNASFRRATVLVQGTELAAARAEGATAQGFLPGEWDVGSRFDVVEGERDVFGDGRITLLPMPGHTPGSMAAQVTLDRDGPFLLAADAAPVRACIDGRYAPKNSWDGEIALRSIEAIARLERAGVIVICGHDDLQWKGLRKGSDFYA